MVLSHGTEEYVEFRKRIVRYKLFDGPLNNGNDVIFGIDEVIIGHTNEPEYRRLQNDEFMEAPTRTSALLS
jgi:hypothetical protein